MTRPGKGPSPARSPAPSACRPGVASIRDVRRRCRSAPRSSRPSALATTTAKSPAISTLETFGRMMPGRRLRIGIDTGGTFTDVVAVDESTGAIVTTKTPTTPHDPSLGVLEGIRKVLRLVGGGEVVAASPRPTGATELLLRGRFDGPPPLTTPGV